MNRPRPRPPAAQALAPEEEFEKYPRSVLASSRRFARSIAVSREIESCYLAPSLQGERVGGAGELFPIEIFTCHLAFLATILSRPRAGQDSAVARAVNTCQKNVITTASYCSFRGPPTCFMPGNSNCCSSSAPSPTVLMASICASDSPAARKYRRSALLSFRSRSAHRKSVGSAPDSP